MKERKIILVSLLTLAFPCVALSACRSNGKADEAADSKEPDIGAMIGKGEDVPGGEPSLLDGKQIYELGESVTAAYSTPNNPDSPGIQYIVDKAALWESPEAAGINRTQMQEQQESYNLSSGEPVWWDIADCNLLIFDVNLKNINYMDARDINISELKLVYETTEKEVKLVSGCPIYFSKSKYAPGDSEYYHYELPKGESIDTQVGWLVDPGQYDKGNLYLCVNYMGDNEQYIRLNLSE